MRTLSATIVLMLLSATAVSAGDAGPAPPEYGVVMCQHIPREPVDDPDRESADYAVGFLFREYDLNGDGSIDFMTARQVESMAEPGRDGAMAGRPLFYWVDLDADRRYDQLWIDQGGRGRCDEIVLYDGILDPGS